MNKIDLTGYRSSPCLDEEGNKRLLSNDDDFKKAVASLRQKMDASGIRAPCYILPDKPVTTSGYSLQERENSWLVCRHGNSGDVESVALFLDYSLALKCLHLQASGLVEGRYY